MSAGADVTERRTGRPIVDIRGLWTVFRTPAAEFVIHRDLDLTIQRTREK